MVNSMRSTVPWVRSRLTSLLKGRGGLSGVQVSVSHAGDAEANASIWCGEARGTEVVPISRAGRLKRQEQFTLDVWFSCIGPGPLIDALEPRCFALFGELEDLLAENTTLDDGSGTVLIRAHLSAYEELLGRDDRGLIVKIKAEVEVEARLS